MKKRILLAISAVVCMFFSEKTFAQIYNSGDDCFYAKAGFSECSYVVKFEGSEGRVWLKSVSHSTVRSNLNKDKKFYENQVWTDGKESVHMYEYDSSKSTYKNVVYKRKMMGSKFVPVYGYNPYVSTYYNPDYGCCGYNQECQTGWYYVAVANDKSSLITWSEPLDNYAGKINNKTEYSRISKEKLLPQSVNYDFLQ